VPNMIFKTHEHRTVMNARICNDGSNLQSKF
jgi:hypothetical protein